MPRKTHFVQRAETKEMRHVSILAPEKSLPHMALTAALLVAIMALRASATLPAPVFMIGAMKSGTSALFDALTNHPNIHENIPLPGEPKFFSKEVHFFNHYSRLRGGRDEYEQHFAEWPPGHYHIDATPEYIFVPHVAQRVLKMYGPSIKIIAVLRDPVERAASHWRHAVVEGKWREKRGEVNDWTLLTTRGFDSFDDKAKHLIRLYELCVSKHRDESPADLWRACRPMAYEDTLVAKGLYDQQMQIWTDAFPAASFCIISSDFFQEEPVDVLTLVTAFLELEPHNWSHHTQTDKHSRADAYNVTYTGETEAEMRQFYQSHGSRMMDLLAKYKYLGCDAAHTDTLTQQFPSQYGKPLDDAPQPIHQVDPKHELNRFRQRLKQGNKRPPWVQ